MHMIAGVLQYVAVASFAEAWIENIERLHFYKFLLVASFAEAWIENSAGSYWDLEHNSRLLRGGVD